AQRHDIELKGVRVHVTKEMVSQPARRIGALPVTVTVPADVAKRLSELDRERLEQVANTCPVKRSLHADVETKMQFVYEM
ncbi:MAG: OsmC family protein, partial [Candidatus Xenobia bacterium]